MRIVSFVDEVAGALGADAVDCRVVRALKAGQLMDHCVRRRPDRGLQAVAVEAVDDHRPRAQGPDQVGLSRIARIAGHADDVVPRPNASVSRGSREIANSMCMRSGAPSLQWRYLYDK
jgi:hypothetical protein